MDFVKPSQWICTVAIAAVFASAVVIDSAAEASEAVTADELLCEFQTRARGEAVPVIGMRSC